MTYVLAISAAFLIAVTAFCFYTGMFDGGDPMGVNTVFIVIYYGIGWLIPTKVALLVWAIWFRSAA